jgi:hypothetical protein
MDKCSLSEANVLFLFYFYSRIILREKDENFGSKESDTESPE